MLSFVMKQKFNSVRVVMDHFESLNNTWFLTNPHIPSDRDSRQTHSGKTYSWLFNTPYPNFSRCFTAQRLVWPGSWTVNVVWGAFHSKSIPAHSSALQQATFPSCSVPVFVNTLLISPYHSTDLLVAKAREDAFNSSPVTWSGAKSFYTM